MSDEFDDESMDWKDYDPFSKLGYIRMIVVKHNFEYNWQGKKDNCTMIAGIEGFYPGFRLNPITKKYRQKSILPTYVDDVHHCAHKINHIFKEKPNGIYELQGEMWSWSSQSYEGEWDGDTEVRNFHIQEVSFDEAVFMCGPEDDVLMEHIAQLKPSKSKDRPYSSTTDISPYMSKHQIMVNHANVLSQIIEGTYHNRTNFNDSTVEELELAIHMMMMQVDSESRYEHNREYVLEIDSKVKAVLEDHQTWMATES